MLKYFLAIFFVPFLCAEEHINHLLKGVLSNGKKVIVEESAFYIDVLYGYQSTAKEWKRGDEIKIYYKEGVWEFQNVTAGNSVWGRSYDYEKSETPKIKYMYEDTIELSNGHVFESLKSVKKSGWKVGDLIFFGHNKESATHHYTLYNFSKGNHIHHFDYLGKNPKISFNLSNILELENRLALQVKGQPDAIKTVSEALIRFSLKLNNRKKPVGAFLFVGPSGVGKTELCKALARTLLRSESEIIRFNLADFNDFFAVRRLIGMPGEDKGGLLIEALKQQRNAIILLDELDKAYPDVLKLFLSVFDEGFLMDVNHERIDCSQCLFVMTTNLGGKEIIQMSRNGKSSEEMLERIEPILVNKFSSELYNRLDPVVFHPLSEEVLDEIIDAMLERVIEEFKQNKEITLLLDPSIHAYFKKYGYSAEQGARLLEKLIEKKLISYLSRAIILEEIPRGSTISVSYDPENFDWSVVWE